MKYLPDTIGLYIHIPFCEKKCLYCDFYSACLHEKVYSDYLSALIREIKAWGSKVESRVDTIYIGGGTPSVLKSDIILLLSAVRESFNVTTDAEITAECNPNCSFEFLESAKKAGVNRLSFGIQSGSDEKLKLLGRRHTVSMAKAAVKKAREIGFDNISLDIMIALPESDCKSLQEDINFICGLNPEHISAYILKIEQNTAFYSMRERLKLPGEDDTAVQYLTVCNELKRNGFEHYEISNFARKGKISRHNLKYWRCDEYLGIGPSAHSFLFGKRFYYPRDIKGFINGNEPIPDGVGGDRVERIMLGLRLCEGVNINFFSGDITEKAKELQKAGFIKLKDGRISLTDEGMLVSNSIITELIYENL